MNQKIEAEILAAFEKFWTEQILPDFKPGAFGAEELKYLHAYMMKAWLAGGLHYMENQLKIYRAA